MNPAVDKYIGKATIWQKEMEKLRKILLDCQLTEDLKWGKPCYSYGKSNIAVMQPFKQYFALLFFKGFMLNDPDGILVKTGENTRVGRQIRFESVREIAELAPVVKAYIYEAIEIEAAGVKASPEKTKESIPEEFQVKLAKIPALKKAFHALTPGRQRGYIFYFSAPKQSKTRESRIEKCMPKILKGKGLSD
jgi:uncharacterized protein YdeI (YjbR/CyaY-like superfamily)